MKGFILGVEAGELHWDVQESPRNAQRGISQTEQSPGVLLVNAGKKMSNQIVKAKKI